MRRSLSAVPVMVGLLGIGCSVETSDPAPLGPESTAPAFHATGPIHVDPVKIGNPYPETGLIWLINPALPNVSQAANGHTIDVRGFGPFTTQPHGTVGVTASSFTWWDETGTEVASGTWTPTRFISYRTYGTEVWRPDVAGGVFLIGGLLIMEVELSTGHTGVLRIDCLIGDKVPKAAAEGIELALRGGPNFQKELHGATVFVRFP